MNYIIIVDHRINNEGVSTIVTDDDSIKIYTELKDAQKTIKEHPLTRNFKSIIFNLDTLSVVDGSEDVREDEMILRKLLWLNHRFDINALYGDDGELSCGNCLIDFKRDSAEDIQNKFIQRGLEKLYKQQKEKTCLCGYVVGGKDKAICPVHKDEKEKICLCGVNGKDRTICPKHKN